MGFRQCWSSWSELEVLLQPTTTPCSSQAYVIARASETIGSFAEGRVRPLGRPAAPHRML